MGMSFIQVIDMNMLNKFNVIVISNKEKVIFIKKLKGVQSMELKKCKNKIQLLSEKQISGMKYSFRRPTFAKKLRLVIIG